MTKLLERPFIRDAALWTVLHFVALGIMSVLLSVVVHISPRAVNLDSLILVLHGIYQAIYLPIAALRGLWPGETSPGALNFLARAGGSVLFGIVFACLIEFKQRRQAR